MGSDRTTANDSAEQQAIAPAGDSKPLVTNQDMQQFQLKTDTQYQFPPPSLQQFNFDQHPLKGYDNCGPVKGDAEGTRENNEFGDNSNERVGRDALNKPSPEAPASLSPEQQKAVDTFVQGNNGFNKAQEDLKNGGNIIDHIDSIDKSSEMMQKSLESLSGKELEGAIGAINKELAKTGQKIAQSPETGDIYMGSKKEDGTIERERRLVQGGCPAT